MPGTAIVLSRQDKDDYQRLVTLVRQNEPHAITWLTSLHEIRERKLYLAEYATWADFLAREVGKTRQYVQRLLEAFHELPGEPKASPKSVRELMADRPTHLDGAAPKPDKAPLASRIEDERLKPVFTAAVGFTHLLTLLGQIKTCVDNLVAGPAGFLLSEQQQVIERDRRSLAALIRFCRPHAVCPYCGGRQEKCEACKGRGWVNEDIYRTSPAAKEKVR